MLIMIFFWSVPPAFFVTGDILLCQWCWFSCPCA